MGSTRPAVLLLAIFLIARATLLDAADPPEPSRAFRMGFTGFVPDLTLEAVDGARRFVRENGDILAHPIEGVPWAEALTGAPFSKALLEEWEGKRSATPQKGKVYLAISPGRGDLKPAEKALPTPPELVGEAYDHPLVKQAYLAYCRRAIEFFRPDYLAIGIEVNEILGASLASWRAYLTLHRHVYEELKKEHPGLPIFASLTLHNLLKSPQATLDEMAKLLDHCDVIAISYYPFLVDGERRLSAFEWLFERFDRFQKPYAIVETNDAAERLVFPGSGLAIEGTPEKQLQYFEKLLTTAQARRFLFVIAFIHQDYDRLWEKIKASAPELFMAWRDCGLLDEGGQERPALALWRRWLARPLDAAARAAEPRPDHDPRWPLWVDGSPGFEVVLPELDARGAAVARRTLERLLAELFGAKAPGVARPGAFEEGTRGTFLVLGSRETSRAVASLAAAGLELAPPERLGDEGFELVTRADNGRRAIVAHASTPRGLKHALQELLFFRVLATAHEGRLEGSLQVVRRPEVAYRGVYMLPCWSAHDSIESWRRVLLFHSELTLNRNWLWLDGFPVAGHTGEYAGTDLADSSNVQGLIDLANDEEMKVLIGGGWFNWHHEKAVGKDLARGREYYLQYLEAFHGFHGFYIEPTGEGSEVAGWRAESEALRDLARTVLATRPDLEMAVAIGKFNSPEHLELLSELDSRRLFWWWCWGDPIESGALERYPSVLRWHVSQRLSAYHGSIDPPSPRDRPLAGIATSYDPGQGFGNPWNGWGKLGTDQRRDFHPRTIPYFAHQYRFRERCWDLEQTEEAFRARLARRLFDDGSPAGLPGAYLALSRAAEESVGGKRPRRGEVAAIRALLEPLRTSTHTPRMDDALVRMEEALEELRNGPQTP